MATKEAKPIFLKVLTIVLVIALANVGYFVYNNANSSQRMTGFSINDLNTSVSNSYNSLSLTSKIFMIGQWVVLLFVLFYAAFRDRRLKITADENIDLHIQRNLDKNKTDLDSLYEIIREKKELPISVISRSFNVNKEVALEWCKILESGELVSISYPGFSEPTVCINEKELKSISYDKSDVSKDTVKIKEEIQKKENKK